MTAKDICPHFISDCLNEEPHQLLGDECWQVLLQTADVYKAEEVACRKSFEQFRFGTQILEQISENIRCQFCHSSLIKAQDNSNIFPSLSCCSCGESFEIDDALEEEIFASCNDCESTNSVVKIGDKWICFSCHTIHDEVGYCEYCNEFIAGNLEDTYLSGCLMCEGQMGHYMNSRAYNRDD